MVVKKNLDFNPFLVRILQFCNLKHKNVIFTDFPARHQRELQPALLPAGRLFGADHDYDHHHNHDDHLDDFDHDPVDHHDGQGGQSGGGRRPAPQPLGQRGHREDDEAERDERGRVRGVIPRDRHRCPDRGHPRFGQDRHMN